MRWLWLASLILVTAAPQIFAAPPVWASPPQAVSCNTTKRLASETQMEAAIYHVGPTNYVAVNSLDNTGKPVHIAVDILAPEYLLRWEEPRVRIGPDGKPITECVPMSGRVSNLVWKMPQVSLQLTSSAQAWHEGRLGRGPRLLYPERFDAQLVGQIFNRERPLVAYVGDAGYVNKTNFRPIPLIPTADCVGDIPTASNAQSDVFFKCDVWDYLTDPGWWELDGEFHLTGICADGNPCAPGTNPTNAIVPPATYEFKPLMRRFDDLRNYFPAYYIEVTLGP